MVLNLILKGQGQSLAKGQRTGQVKVGHAARHSIRSDDTSISAIFIRLSQLVQKL